MKKRTGIVLIALAAMAAWPSTAPGQTPVGTAFTYQGQLKQAGLPASGEFDFRFTLYNGPYGGTVAGPLYVDDIWVENGLFTSPLDFGGVFQGDDLWLGVAVRPGSSSGSYTTLQPRQQLTAVPYALYGLDTQKIRGRTVSTSQPNRFDALCWDGSEWAPSAVSVSGPAGGDLNGNYPNPTVDGLQGRPVNSADPGEGQVLKWSLGQWSPQTDAELVLPYEGGGTFDNDAALHLYNQSTLNGRGLLVYGFYGIEANSWFENGWAVAANAISANGIGVRADASGGNGRGVDAYANGDSGTAVFARATGPAGKAVVGIGHGYGGDFTANAAGSGVGVSGVGPGTGVRGDGGYFGGMFFGGPSVGCNGVYAQVNCEYGVGLQAQATGVNGVAVRAEAAGSATLAGDFLGDVHVSGEITTAVLTITGGSDLAEKFEVSGSPRSGTVVVIDPERPGQLKSASEPYDCKVAGVISGANGLAPGMIMKAEGHDEVAGKHAVALTGRVWCWCDASYGTIEPGDRLTTSATTGHAMKVTDRDRADGAVIGKAMTRLETGRGLVLVLVQPQ